MVVFKSFPKEPKFDDAMAYMYAWSNGEWQFGNWHARKQGSGARKLVLGICLIMVGRSQEEGECPREIIIAGSLGH